MHNIEYQFNVGEEVNLLNPQGKLISDIVDKVEINIGSTFARESSWVETSKKLETTIHYKLRNQPAGFSYREESLFKKEVNE